LRVPTKCLILFILYLRSFAGQHTNLHKMVTFWWCPTKKDD